MATLDLTVPRPWCLFKSDARPFAVALEDVAEVVDADRLVRLSHCPPHMLGLCSVRRDIVPIVSLTGHAASEPRAAEARLVVLILRTEQGAWGIRIDREGTLVAEGRPEAPDAPADASAAAAVVGSVRRGDAAHALIDPEQTWRNVRASIEQWYKK